MSDDSAGRDSEADEPITPDPQHPALTGARPADAARDPLGAFAPPPRASDEPPLAPDADAAAPESDVTPYAHVPAHESDSAPVAGVPRFVQPYAPYPAQDDPYADVPASIELSYSQADLGLSANAYERAFPYEKRRRHAAGQRARRIGRELAETVILAVLIFFGVKAVIQNFRVEGASMAPSLHNQQYLLVNKAIYFRLDMDRVHNILPFVPGDDGEDRHLFRAPRRGDVVVFRFHLDPTRDFIKRVIGVPGDTVEVKDATVFINGSPLTEDYINNTPNYTYGPRTVPEGHYFVLGDNRRNSFDSHAWGSSCPPEQQCDFVPEENIIGQAWVTYWPFDDLGLINNKTLKPSAP
jgi:signal peptidase I